MPRVDRAERPLVQPAAGGRVGALGLALAVVVTAPLASIGGTPVQVWQTTADFSSALTRQVDLALQPAATAEAAAFAIRVDDTTRYQQMDGFGVSITDASAYNLTTHLSAAKRAEVLNQLFGADGIGMSLVRQPMGACDFNRQMYSYDDATGDTDLASFSVAKDDEVIVPVLKQALGINPALRVIATPWSAPGWMKTSGSMIGGTLKPELSATYAKYFARFVDAYAQRGIPVYAITPQNEPGYSPTTYPGMTMSAAAQTDFIKNYLGPQMAGLAQPPRILCYDHNYDGWSTPATILADPAAAAFVAGSAFHHYGGSPSSMTTLHNQNPDKGVWFTEGGIGDWNNTFGNLAHEMIAIPRNWAKSVIFWNAALDEHNGPALIGANPNEGMVTIRSDATDVVQYNHQFYYLGHESKFVRPGAWRIASTSADGNIETVAFLNPDRSIVLVVYNANAGATAIAVSWQGVTFGATVPATSLTTYVWPLTPHVAWSAKTAPARPGQDIAVTLAAANDGTAAWSTDYAFRVGASWDTGQAGDPALGYLVSTGNPLGTAAPGGSAAPWFLVTAPSTPGTYTLTLHPYISGADPPSVATDATVTLNVVAATPSRLGNVSVRALAGSGAETLTLGFVARGSDSKPVLIRAIGPTLAVLGVADPVANPRLGIFDANGAQIGANDDWGGDVMLAANFTRLGAFGLPANSADAALYLALAPGAYTAQVNTEEVGRVALLEAYEGDASSTRFVNVSARNQVGTGSGVLIIGFVITGDAPKTVLIRGVGPSLALLGLSAADVLADPQLTVFNRDRLPIGGNDDWGGNPNLRTAMSRVGAFPLSGDSKDAAVLMTLDPGLYSAQVVGAADSTGIALVEVYDLDH